MDYPLSFCGVAILLQLIVAVKRANAGLAGIDIAGVSAFCISSRVQARALSMVPTVPFAVFPDGPYTGPEDTMD